MFLVLALVAAMAAIAWPSLERLYDDHKVREAAESVRARLAWTRLSALETGTTYQFCYEPGGRRFLASPYQPPLIPAGRGVPAASAGRPQAITGMLPAGMEFTLTSLCPIGTLPLSSPVGTHATGAGWSTPLLFYPEGSASEAAVTIVGPRRQSIQLLVRELTGSILVSRVQQDTPHDVP